MRKGATWGTTDEIIQFATIFNVSLLVFAVFGNSGYLWQKFVSCDDNKSKTCIYLQNISGNHFDVAGFGN